MDTPYAVLSFCGTNTVLRTDFGLSNKPVYRIGRASESIPRIVVGLFERRV